MRTDGATELREAAEALRSRPEFGTQLELALAKWLDDIASGWTWDDSEEALDYDGDLITLAESMDSHPLALARLINSGEG